MNKQILIKVSFYFHQINLPVGFSSFLKKENLAETAKMLLMLSK